MIKVYAAQSVAKKHIVEQCGNCNLKKNNNGLYNHDNIVKVRKKIEGKLNKVFLDHNTGLGMIKLLDNTNNAINMVKTNQMISVDSVINDAKKEAMTATAASCEKDKPRTKSHPQSQHGKKPSVRPNIRTLSTKQSWAQKKESSKSSIA